MDADTKVYPFLCSMTGCPECRYSSGPLQETCYDAYIYSVCSEHLYKRWKVTKEQAEQIVREANAGGRVEDR